MSIALFNLGLLVALVRLYQEALRGEPKLPVEVGSVRALRVGGAAALLVRALTS